jgi:hypothetical protein
LKKQLAAKQLAAKQLAAKQLAAKQLAAKQLAAKQLAAKQYKRGDRGACPPYLLKIINWIFKQLQQLVLTTRMKNWMTTS